MLKTINGLSLPSIELSGGDGYIRDNRVFIKQKASDVQLITNDKNNSYIVNVRNLYIFVRSQNFRYNFWFVPIKATLDVQISKVSLDFEVMMWN